MDFNTAMQRVLALGWGGFSFWRLGADAYMACLLRNDIWLTPDHDTNLWESASTPEEALRLIVEEAERLGPPSQAREH
jgi:hypothetical protein